MTGRRLAAVATALGVSALAAVAPAPAANLVLEVTDGAGVGFNDPTPVAPVAGNPMRTLGEQRRRVFEAVAWEVGRRLASEITIRIEASWEELSCTALRGTLASAGPTFVFRDFPGAVRSGTWYVSAQANALAASDLNGSPSMRIRYNRDVGTSGCLERTFWDYRIGVQGSRGVNMESTTRHEIYHGLGFLPLVNEETGEKFQGGNDAYMLHLEDHALGRTWNRLSNAQRKTSSTRTGKLHWVGNNVLLRAPALVSGGDPASGHPNMFAPLPLDEGSSVSHWDVSLEQSANELMEPFATSSNTDLLSLALLQDLGWPINRPAVDWLDDVDGNGAPELAVLLAGDQPAGHRVVVIDSRSGDLLQTIELPAERAAVDLATVAHFDGGPAAEIAVLTWRPRGNQVRVFVYDGESGELLRSRPFPNGFVRSLLAVPDFRGGSADELLVFGSGPGTGARGWIKDASAGGLLKTLSFPAKQKAAGVALLDSFAGTGAAEVAILLAVPREEKWLVKIRDADSGAVLGQLEFPQELAAAHVAGLPDFGGTPAGEVAVAGIERLTGRPVVRVFDAGSGELLSERSFASDALPVGLEVLPDFARTPAAELVLVERKAPDLKMRARVLDAADLFEISSPGLANKHAPVAVGVAPQVGGSGAGELVVVAEAARDRKTRVFVIDGRGARLSTTEVP